MDELRTAWKRQEQARVFLISILTVAALVGIAYELHLVVLVLNLKCIV